MRFVIKDWYEISVVATHCNYNEHVDCPDDSAAIFVVDARVVEAFKYFMVIASLEEYFSQSIEVCSNADVT
jgi:hypothetical protein